MTTHQLVFNHKIYSFESSVLSKIAESMFLNEHKHEEGKKYTISFVSDKGEMKTFDELDYHEFQIDGSFRVSQLLCNVANVYGERVYTQFYYYILQHLNKDVEDTDWFDALSARDALLIARIVLKEESDIIKFKDLLATMFLYECARFDYEQTITDADGFRDLEFINGIGIKKVSKDGSIILKPVHSIHDEPLDKYLKVAHLLIPHQVMATIFRTVNDCYQNLNGVVTLNNFFKKLEQLTGCKI